MLLRGYCHRTVYSRLLFPMRRNVLQGIRVQQNRPRSVGFSTPQRSAQRRTLILENIIRSNPITTQAVFGFRRDISIVLMTVVSRYAKRYYLNMLVYCNKI